MEDEEKMEWSRKVNEFRQMMREKEREGKRETSNSILLCRLKPFRYWPNVYLIWNEPAMAMYDDAMEKSVNGKYG